MPTSPGAESERRSKARKLEAKAGPEADRKRKRALKHEPTLPASAPPLDATGAGHKPKPSREQDTLIDGGSHERKATGAKGGKGVKHDTLGVAAELESDQKGGNAASNGGRKHSNEGHVRAVEVQLVDGSTKATIILGMFRSLVQSPFKTNLHSLGSLAMLRIHEVVYLPQAAERVYSEGIGSEQVD